jgi:hypothetical protein
MKEILLEAFRHHAWANKQLLAACRSLPHEQLRLPGTAAATDLPGSRTRTPPTWTSSNGAPTKMRRSGKDCSRSRWRRPSSSSWTKGPTRPNRACSSSRRSTTGTPTVSRSVPSSPASASNHPTSKPGRTRKPRATRGNDRRRPGSPSAMRRRLLQVVADYTRLSAVQWPGRAGHGRASLPQYPGVAARGLTVRPGGLILEAASASPAAGGVGRGRPCHQRLAVSAC